ncbi:hypothetical protein COCOBI_01-8460 [Coccomyxa sp. Obi]|nr:hypothetical protein COCOBI_01-8460 [Coccomyxa sp. Obi]
MERLLPLLQDAAAVVEELAPKMLPTLRTAQKSDARKDSDRSHKPLFPNRKRQAATIATATDAFERGRSVVRQLGLNIRGPKRMYAKRVKRGKDGAP